MPQIADRSAPHLAVLHQVVDDVPREVARHGEADALIAAALAEDAGVDADQLAARVDQRAAGVARIDRRVGLDEVLVVGEAHVRAARRADDAGGDRLTQLERAADRQHPFADLQLARIAPRHDRQAASTSIFSSAMSVAGSVPITLPLISRLSGSATVISRTFSPTTWLLVTT